jgi:hypothetical protein
LFIFWDRATVLSSLSRVFAELPSLDSSVKPRN